MERFEGRVAVVTGGASGIGLGLARRFLKEGMKVVIADVDASLDTVTAELAPLGEVVGRRVDVAKWDEVQALADFTVERFGAVHLVCNNAGVGGLQRFETTSLETWEWTLGVNLWGVIYGCKAFLPILEQQDEAHILNTASMAGFFHGPAVHPYNVSKAGVVALTESLNQELRQFGSRVGMSVLCPAHVASNIADDERNAPPSHTLRDDADAELKALRDKQAAGMAAGMNPDEVADICMAAIRAGRTHIFTHPEWLKLVEYRIGAIMAGEPVILGFGGKG